LTRQENYWVKGKKGWIRIGYEVEKKMQKYIISFATGQSTKQIAICILQSVLFQVRVETILITICGLFFNQN
jgi:hypothetical protein